MALKEIDEYRQFTGKAEHQKAINNFLGLLDGISIDGVIDQAEIDELRNWYSLYRGLIDRHPFNELLPAIDDALSDGQLTYDEVEDLRWLCQQVTSGSYYDLVTCCIQSLHGVIHGVLANNTLTDTEIKNLSSWLEDHSILRGSYPFDEIYSLVSAVLEDGNVSDDERNILKAFFSEFVDTRDSCNLNILELRKLQEEYSVQGVCAHCPDIFIPGHVFCFTGASARGTRNDIANMVADHGGEFKNTVTGKTDYLIVGNEGNPCWAYSCYGRKIEKAVSLRKEGGHIIIVNENDFWNVLEGNNHV